MKNLLFLSFIFANVLLFKVQGQSNTDFMVVSDDFTVCDSQADDTLEFVVITHDYSQPLFDISPVASEQEPVLDRLTNDNSTWIYKLPVKQQYIDAGEVEIIVGRSCVTTNNYNLDAECLYLSFGTRVWNDTLRITFVQNNLQPAAPSVIGASRTDTDVELVSPRYGSNFPIESFEGNPMPPNIIVANGSGNIEYFNYNIPVSTQVRYNFNVADYNLDTLVFTHFLESDEITCNAVEDSILVVFDLSVSTDDQIGETLNVYPNPASDMLRVEMSQKYSTASFQLLNSNGSIVIEQQVISNDNVEISLEGLSPGIYFLDLEVDSGHYFKKVIKK